jgi:hypothetical protein
VSMADALANVGFWAHFGSAGMPGLSLECAPKRTSIVRSEFMRSSLATRSEDGGLRYR